MNKNALDGFRAKVAVIGSGPGGAISAATLQESGVSTLLIEEGPSERPGDREPFSADEMAAKYRNGGQTVAFGPARVQYVEGRCVGGGSEINSGLYHRTPGEILEQWRRDYGVIGSTIDDLRPFFERCERAVNVCKSPGPPAPMAAKLRAGATAMGWSSIEVPRWVTYGTGRYDSLGTPIGEKNSMSATFIPRFLAAGGRLESNLRAIRIQRSGGRFHIECERTPQGGRPSREIVIAEKVVVSGGAVQTPLLLRRSGLTHRIGDTLHLHPTVKIVAEFEEEVTCPGAGVPSEQVKEFSPELSFGCSISTLGHLAVNLLMHRDALRTLKGRWRNMATYYVMARGDGIGSVRSLPGARDAFVRYQISETDARNLRKGIAHLARLLFAAGAIRLYPVLAGSEVLEDEGSVSRMYGQFEAPSANVMTIHLFSSCPMGEVETVTATDSFGRVRGTAGLVIADASILPTSLGVNPQGSIMALTSRNIEFLISEGYF